MSLLDSPLVEINNKNTLDDVFKLSETDRINCAALTAGRYLEKLAEAQVFGLKSDAEVREMTILTCQRAIAIINGDAEQARAIEEQGNATIACHKALRELSEEVSQ